MKIALWAAGLLAAVTIVVAANVLLLRTGDTGSEPIGTLSPTLFRPPAAGSTTTGPTTGPTTTTEPTTTGADHTGTDSHGTGSDGTGSDDSEDD